MMGSSWESLNVINIFMAPLPPSRVSFTNLLFLVNQDDGNSLNGARVASYASATEAATANTAGYISALTLDFLQAGFAQVPTPNKIKVAYRDVTGVESYATALAAIRAADDDWYGIVQYSRVQSDIVLLADLIEATNEKIYIAQDDDSSWLNATLPAGLSTIDNKERTIVLYHSADAQPGDIAWAASRLVFDPDEKSAGWEGQVRDVASITAVTAAERDFIEANSGNVGLAFSSADFYVSPGQNLNTRGIYEIVSADWFKARVGEDLALLKLQHTARGEKIVVDISGQTKVLGILTTRLKQGEQVGHFAKGQIRATAEAITQSDIDNKRLRFKVESQIAADARKFTVNVYLQSSPLQEV